MTKLSPITEVQLKQYVITRRLHQSEMLLRGLDEAGISIDCLDELSLQPSNPENIQITPDYLMLRIETAYELRSDLAKKGNPIKIERCYSAIDNLIIEERAAEPKNVPYKILEGVLDYIRNPNQDPFSFVNRMKTADAGEVIFGAVVFGGLGGYGVYSQTSSMTYSVLAGAALFITGGAVVTYLDSWTNNDLISHLRKLFRSDLKDTPSLMVQRLEQKKRRFERLCTLALN